MDMFEKMRPGFESWISIDDVVMGGVSRSEVGSVERDGLEVLRFEGDLSLEQNGGFCSCRAPLPDGALEGALGLVIRARASRPLRVMLTLRPRGGRGSSWRLPFECDGEEWVERELDLARASLWRRGTLLPSGPFDSKAVDEVGMLLADSQDGPFFIEVSGLRVV